MLGKFINQFKISASGLVVKSIVAIDGPRVRFAAGAFLFPKFFARSVSAALSSTSFFFFLLIGHNNNDHVSLLSILNFQFFDFAVSLKSDLI